MRVTDTEKDALLMEAVKLLRPGRGIDGWAAARRAWVAKVDAALDLCDKCLGVGCLECFDTGQDMTDFGAEAAKHLEPEDDLTTWVAEELADAGLPADSIVVREVECLICRGSGVVTPIIPLVHGVRPEAGTPEPCVQCDGTGFLPRSQAFPTDPAPRANHPAGWISSPDVPWCRKRNENEFLECMGPKGHGGMHFAIDNPLAILDGCGHVRGYWWRDDQ